MKSLPDILHDALLLSEQGFATVIIARGASEALDARSQAYQFRLYRKIFMHVTTYWCEARSWLGETWSDWKERQGWLGGAGFDIADVLATDWRIVS